MDGQLYDTALRGLGAASAKTASAERILWRIGILYRVMVMVMYVQCNVMYI